MTTYATSYYLKITGTIIAGPRASMTVDGKIQDLATCTSIDDVKEWVRERTSFLRGRFEIWSRQYDGMANGFRHTHIETIEVGR